MLLLKLSGQPDTETITLDGQYFKMNHLIDHSKERLDHQEEGRDMNEDGLEEFPKMDDNVDWLKIDSFNAYFDTMLSMANHIEDYPYSIFLYPKNIDNYFKEILNANEKFVKDEKIRLSVAKKIKLIYEKVKENKLKEADTILFSVKKELDLLLPEGQRIFN